MRKPPKLFKVNFKGLTGFALVATVAAACGGRNLHKGTPEDPDVLLRKWTLSTTDSVHRDTGDRGSEFSNPVVFENTLVFGNRSVGLISLYPTINQQRWVLPIRGGVVSELTIEKGLVYFGGGDGFLYCVSLDTGRVQWRYELRNPVISRPTVSQGRVLVTTSDDAVYALDAGTGKWLWHYKRKGSGVATILGAAAPLVDGNQVFVGLSDGFLVALSFQEGQLRWERKLHQGSKFTDVDAHPILWGESVFVPSYDGALYSLRRTTGDVLWRFDAGGSKTVTIEGTGDAARLYMPSSDGFVYVLDPTSAKVLWKFELDRGVPTQVVLTDRYAIFASSHQYLYVTEKATGKLVYRYNAGWGSGFLGSLAYDNATRRLYALSSGGNLYAFAVRGPETVRTRKMGQTHPYRF